MEDRPITLKNLAVLIATGILVAVVAAVINGEGRFASPVPTPFTLNSTEIPGAIEFIGGTSTPFSQNETCSIQIAWTPPKPTETDEWIYDCLSSGLGNWIGQPEEWKAANWVKGSGKSEVVNIVVPTGASEMGIGCNPCTIIAPNNATVTPECLRDDLCFAEFTPNLTLDVKSGEVYKAIIFGGDTCPSRPEVIPPCAPEIYIWFNLGSQGDLSQNFSDGSSHILPYQSTSIGTGIFANVTLSDGGAQYDLVWLRENDHFEIQRIWPQDDPSGCAFAQYQASRLWISAGSSTSIYVNDENVGTITTVTQVLRHGYIAEVAIEVGDEICISPIPPSGFHIIFGPDIYYHYDSYCYREEC